MSQQPVDPNSILMGGGSPALKFDTIGAVHTGTVVAEPTASQQTDFRTKTPEFWPDGSPKMQVLVQMSTTLRDPEKPEDDGTRTLYIKGKELTNAIRNAVRQSGADGIHTGGVLTVQYVADGPAQAGMNAPKLYAATYQRPAVSLAGVGAPAGAPQQQVAPVAVQQQVVPQPTVAQQTAAAVGVGPARPANVDPAMWERLTADQRAAVAAAAAPVAQPIPY
jgi:hypothetical protein